MANIKTSRLPLGHHFFQIKRGVEVGIIVIMLVSDAIEALAIVIGGSGGEVK